MLVPTWRHRIRLRRRRRARGRVGRRRARFGRAADAGSDVTHVHHRPPSPARRPRRRPRRAAVSSRASTRWAAAAGWLALCAMVGGGGCRGRAESAGAAHRALGAAARAARRARDHRSSGCETPGRAPLRGRVRDAWQPTAGAPLERLAVSIAPGEVQTVTGSAPSPSPWRAASLEFVVVRSDGPLRFAGRQTASMRAARCGSSRLSPPAVICPRAWRGCARWMGRRACRCAGRAPSSTVSASTSAEMTCGRSTGARRPDRPRTMLRTWRPERDRHVVIVIDTGRTAAARVGDGVRLDAAMESALLLAALARAGGRPHAPPDVRPRDPCPGDAASTARRCSPLSSTRWPRSSRS